MLLDGMAQVQETVSNRFIFDRMNDMINEKVDERWKIGLMRDHRPHQGGDEKVMCNAIGIVGRGMEGDGIVARHCLEDLLR
jgi:hypothetical protein